jgi:hypothetical protein
MSPRHLLASALLFTALFACTESGETAGKAEVAPASPPNTSAVPVEPPPIEPKPAEAGEPAGTDTDTGDEVEPAVPLPESFEQVGVEVCDQYVADYSKCIAEKVPEADREAARRVVFENVGAWKQTASAGAAGQKSLQTACRIAREQAKRATATLDCAW